MMLSIVGLWHPAWCFSLQNRSGVEPLLVLAYPIPRYFLLFCCIRNLVYFAVGFQNTDLKNRVQTSLNFILEWREIFII